MFLRLARSISVTAAVLFALGAAAGANELGPAVGEKIPHTLEAPDVSGETRGLENLSGKNGLALFFIRSIDWCPYCKAQAIDVSNAYGDFQSRGLEVVFVSYDAAKEQAEFARRQEFRPILLSDPRSEIIDSFGLRNESHTSGRFAGIPHPAVFIVAPDGEILAKLYEKDYASNEKSYRERPAVDAILAAADAALEDRQR